MNDITRRRFIKNVMIGGLAGPWLGSAGAWARQEPSPNSKLNHVTFGGGGFARSDVRGIMRDPRVNLYAIVDIDSERCQPMREQYPEAKYYQDWREFFAQEADNFDSCNVSTPDHMHGSIAATALRHGKHVYCQKPLCRTLRETRTLTEEAAARPDLVTQMGIQIHSREEYQLAKRIIQDGVIGKVHTVCSWSHSNRRTSIEPLPERTDPIPAGLDWDGWLGMAAERPFLEGQYHPGAWRYRIDFGCGRIGDFGTHILDPVRMALELGPPLSLQSAGSSPEHADWPFETEIEYRFAPTPYSSPEGVTLHWFDGRRHVNRELIANIGDTDLFNAGSALVGTEGTMLLRHIGDPELYPEEKFADYTPPQLELKTHWQHFVDAIHGEGQTTAGFGYAGPLTEILLTGLVAQYHPGETMAWDAANLRFTSHPGAAQYIARRARAGWEIPGLFA